MSIEYETLEQIEADWDETMVKFECNQVVTTGLYVDLVNDLNKIIERLLEYQKED